jgi:hypothetical protein
MCPACGSIDLNLMDVERPTAAVWVARETAPAEEPRALDGPAVS